MPTLELVEVPADGHNDPSQAEKDPASNTQQSSNPPSVERVVYNPHAMGNRSQYRNGSIKAMRKKGAKRKKSSKKDDNDYDGPCQQCIADDKYKNGETTQKPPHRAHKKGCYKERPRKSKKSKREADQPTLWASMKQYFYRKKSNDSDDSDDDDEDMDVDDSNKNPSLESTGVRSKSIYVGDIVDADGLPQEKPRPPAKVINKFKDEIIKSREQEIQIPAKTKRHAYILLKHIYKLFAHSRSKPVDGLPTTPNFLKKYAKYQHFFPLGTCTYELPDINFGDPEHDMHIGTELFYLDWNIISVPLFTLFNPIMPRPTNLFHHSR